MDYAQKLEAIHADVRQTRGRVTSLETNVDQLRRDLYGNPDQLLPSGLPDLGLVGVVHGHGEIIALVRSALKVGKWLLAVFSTATAALVANFVANALPIGG